MWPELSAEAIGVHPLQYGGDAALVSTDELDDAAGGGGLQRHGGAAVTTSVYHRWACAIVPRMDVV